MAVSYGYSMFNFLTNCQTFPEWLHCFTFPLPVYESFNFFKSLQLLLLSRFFFFDYSHPSWSNIWYFSIWLPRWSSSVILICISLITNDFEHLFVLSNILISFLKKWVFKSLPIFSFFAVKCSTPLLYLQIFGHF